MRRRNKCKKLIKLVKCAQKKKETLLNKIKKILSVSADLIKRKAEGVKKNSFTILTWLTFILAILAILPYGLEIYYSLHYRPTLTIVFLPVNIAQDKDGGWLADYNLSVSGNRYLILPTKIYLSYDDPLILPNEHPNMPGGLIGCSPAPDTKSLGLALIWDCSNSVIYLNRSIGFLARARMTEKKIVLPVRLVIYAETDPYDLGFWRVFYHSRLYNGTVSYSLDFIEGKRQEIIVRLK